MEDVLMVIAVFGSISYAIVTIIKSISEHILKRKLIDRAIANENFGGALSESLKSISFSGNAEHNRYPSLKWGLLFLFAGIGLIIIEFLEYDFDNSSLPIGIISASVAMGFLVYYFIVKNDLKKKGS